LAELGPPPIPLPRIPLPRTALDVAVPPKTVSADTPRVHYWQQLLLHCRQRLLLRLRRGLLQLFLLLAHERRFAVSSSFSFLSSSSGSAFLSLLLVGATVVFLRHSGVWGTADMGVLGTIVLRHDTPSLISYS
jgi:hypothetical protein